jgi:predicted nucleic acid-binding protein
MNKRLVLDTNIIIDFVNKEAKENLKLMSAKPSPAARNHLLPNNAYEAPK